MTDDLHKQVLGRTEWLAMKLFARRFDLPDHTANQLWFELSDALEEEYVATARFVLEVLELVTESAPAPEEQNEPELFRPITRRRWTLKEVRTLVARDKAGVPHAEIAEELGRTTTAIQVALYKLQTGAALGTVNREKKK